MGWTKTDTEHFRIYAKGTSSADRELIGTALERAYEWYGSMGFDYSLRTRWPVEVVIRPLDNDGQYSDSFMGINYGFIEIDNTGLSSLGRITAGHEFMHLVQSLYDPRNRFQKGTSAAPHHWLNEAVATWAEWYFSDNPAIYTSQNFIGNENQAFHGLEAGKGHEDHGYGLGPVVASFVGGTPSRLSEVYEGIRDGEAAVAAMDVVNPFEDWWRNFWYGYVGRGGNATVRRRCGNKKLRNETSFPCTEWMANQGDYRILDHPTGEELVSSERLEIPIELPDLSAGIYWVRFEHDRHFPWNIYWKLRSSSPDDLDGISVFLVEMIEGDLVIFKTHPWTNPGDFTQWQWLTDEWERQLQRPGGVSNLDRHLGFLVVNGRHRPPFTDVTTLQLEVHFSFPESYDTAASVRVNADILEGDEPSEGLAWAGATAEKGPGDFPWASVTYDTCTVAWSDVLVNGSFHSTGSIDIRFDPNRSTIAVSVEERGVHSEDSELWYQSSWRGEDIPVTKGSFGGLVYGTGASPALGGLLEGLLIPSVSENDCSHLAQFSREWTFRDGEDIKSGRVTSYTCDPLLFNVEVRVWMSPRPQD